MCAAVFVFFATACGSSSSSPDSGNGSGSACTGMLYDACNPSASNCMSPYTCKSYGTSSFSVCVPAQNVCTSGGCPNQGSQPVTCNTMGFCKPAAPNSDCTSP